MKQILRALALVLMLSTSVAFAQTPGWTTVQASSIKIGTTALANGTIMISPTDYTGNPIPFTVSGGGVQSGASFVGLIVNGAITTAQGGGTFQVPDQCLANSGVQNMPLYYRVDVYNPSTKLTFTYYRVTSICGSTWSFDTYAPTNSASVAVTGLLSGTVPPSKCIAPSLFTNTSTSQVMPCVGGHFITPSGSGGASLPVTTAVLKGDGQGGALAATAGTDYATASSVAANATAISAEVTRATSAEASKMANTAAAVASAVQAQTGCNTAGYVWSPQSNACVSASGSGASYALVADRVTNARPQVLNLYDPNRDTLNNGIDPSSGQLSPIGNYSATDFIPVQPGVIITTTAGTNYGNPSFGGAWYDANKAYLSGFTLPAGNLTPPAGAYYMRQTHNASLAPTMMVVTSSSMPSQYIAFGYDDPATEARNIQAAITAKFTSAKTLGVFGDSISALFQPNWETPVVAALGSTLQFADAHAGRSSNNNFENWGNDGTGGFTPQSDSSYYEKGAASGQSLASALSGVTATAVFMGANDCSNYPSNLGSPSDAPSRTGTLSAQYAFIYSTIQTANPHTRIVAIAPYLYQPNNGHGGCTTLAGEQAINTTIVQSAAYWGVRVINLFTDSGINSANWSTALMDGLHPSSTGFAEFVVPTIVKGLRDVIN